MKKILGVIVTVECGYCHGKRRLPGGKYKDQGEVVNCPVCGGYGVEKAEISIADFKKKVLDAE